MSTIYLGYDHGGFPVREAIISHLQGKNYTVHDLGNKALDPTDDYPDFAEKVAIRIQKDPQALGILLCRSGTGVSIVANKFKGIRAPLAMTAQQARAARLDDDANILCLSAELTPSKEILSLIDEFLDHPYLPQPRFERRKQKISTIEQHNFL